MRTTGSVNDDVYYDPATAPALADVGAAAPVPDPPATPEEQDAYYDPQESRDATLGRGYYDITYNDPYYFNQGRFGFNMGLAGWRTGWSGPGWGMGMGWGMGYGAYGGLYDPFWGWNNPFGWNYLNGGYYGSSWGWNDPYVWNRWGPGWGGYGAYQSPWGSCWACYSPVVYADGGTSGIHVGHRGSVSGGASGIGQPSRRPVRNPIGLGGGSGLVQQHDRNARTLQQRQRPIDPTLDRTRTRPSDDVRRERSIRERTAPDRTREHRAPERTFDGGGTRTAPSRDTGGGGGGTRTSPSRR